MNDLELLHDGLDRAGIALWLGHESLETTAIYLQADMKLKEQPLAKTNAREMGVRRYEPDDHVVAFLEEPLIMPINGPEIVRIPHPPDDHSE
jgi:integrase/recombinase XerD